MASCWRRKEDHRNMKQALLGFIRACTLCLPPIRQGAPWYVLNPCIFTDARGAWVLVRTNLCDIEFKSLTRSFPPSFRSPSNLTWQAADVGKGYAAKSLMKVTPVRFKIPSISFLQYMMMYELQPDPYRRETWLFARIRLYDINFHVCLILTLKYFCSSTLTQPLADTAIQKSGTVPMKQALSWLVKGASCGPHETSLPDIMMHFLMVWILYWCETHLSLGTDQAAYKQPLLLYRRFKLQTSCYSLIPAQSRYQQGKWQK